jgi:hypothetical protein
MKKRWRSVLGALLAVSLAACSPTTKEKQVITELTSQMKPVCMGRFVIQVPQDMTLGGRVTLYYGLNANFETVDVEIESLDATPGSMRTQMDAAANKIDKGNKNRKTKKSMLLDYRPISDNMIYLRKQDDIAIAAGSDHELHVLVGRTQLVLKADSYEGIPGAGRFAPDGKVETPEQVAARLFKIASQIRPVDYPEQAGPGFCLGSVVIDSDNDEESADLYFRTEKYPDLLLDLYSKALTPNGEEKPLLERAAQTESRFNVDVIRKGHTTMGGMKAQEWLVKGIDDHDKRILHFDAESMRPDPALSRPFLSMELQAGGRRPSDGEYVDSSLSPHEATALWDAIVASLRLRPDAVRAKATPGTAQP